VKVWHLAVTQWRLVQSRFDPYPLHHAPRDLKNMPKKLEQALKRQADNKGLRGERKNAYVYGTVRNAIRKANPKRSGR